MKPMVWIANNRQKIKPLLLLFLIALLVRFAAAVIFQFDGLYGQDPFAYYNYSLELREAFRHLQPPPPFFWPIGYPLLVVLGTLVAGVRPFAGQLVSIVAGAFIAPLVFLIVCEVKPGAKAGGLVAGLLAAVSGQLMLSSTAVMSDAAGLAWLTLSAWAMLRYTRVLRPGWLILSSLTLGLAILTRWSMALAALSWALSAYLAWRAASWTWRRMAAAAAVAALAGGLVVVAQFLPGLGRAELTHVGDLQVVGWNLVNAFRSTVANSDGIFHYERPVGVYYALPVVHPAFIFPLMTPFLLLGLWSLRARSRPLAALLLGWPLTVYIFLAGIAWENPRFSLAMFPPLVILVGLGLQQAWDWSRVWVSGDQRPIIEVVSPGTSGPEDSEKDMRWIAKNNAILGRPFDLLSHYWRPFLAGWCALALAGSLAWSMRDLRNFTAVNRDQISAAQWVAAQVPLGARVITFGLTQTMDHRTELDVEEIYLQDEISLSELLASQMPTYLLLDLDNIESQWIGKSPQLNYQWLQENTTMREIGRYPPYTLYHIEE